MQQRIKFSSFLLYGFWIVRNFLLALSVANLSFISDFKSPKPRPQSMQIDVSYIRYIFSPTAALIHCVTIMTFDSIMRLIISKNTI
jgi:hypothetical protein